MFEEKAQSYRVKDKQIYRVKLACQNTKVYRVNTQLTKGTITLLYFFCFFLHMRTLSVLDKYRANVLGPCRARAITLFTVFPWRVTNVNFTLQMPCSFHASSLQLCSWSILRVLLPGSSLPFRPASPSCK